MIEILGFVAGSLTTIAFLPQLIKIIKTKEVKDLSLFMYLIFCFGVALWLIYGIYHKSLPIIIFNAITFFLNFIISLLIAINNFKR